MNLIAHINTEGLPPQIADEDTFRLVCDYLDVLCELYEEVIEEGCYPDPCVNERAGRGTLSRRPKYTPYRIL